MSVIIGLAGGGTDYAQAIEDAGGVAVNIPNTNPEELPQLFNYLDGIVFTGGSDVDPLYYNEEDHPYLQGTSPGRDQQEMMLFEYMTRHTNKPFIGICRGLQLMNVAMGGTLWQDIKAQRPTHIHGDSCYTFSEAHMMHIVEDSMMRKFFPSMMAVNSFHHQGIKDLAPGLKASGYAPDGLIEAIEDTKHPFRIAFQWHPEAMFHKHGHFAHMFRDFVKAAEKLAR